MCHTGLVEKVVAGRVYTIEGNTSSSPGVVANGGMVRAKSYPLNYAKIAGYGRPDYSMIGDDEEMDAVTFEKYLNEYRQKLRDNDSSAYSAQARQFAIENGLVSGGEPLPNGEPNYMWEDFMIREQFVTVLYRFAQLMGKA